jgi:hypothetical protein
VFAGLMMEISMANDVGKLRRSAIVSTFGPGAVVDFRTGGASVSGVVAGLDEWDESFRPAGLQNTQKIHEPRLERKLGVRGFRLPPVIDENWQDEQGQPDKRRLVAARFPDWLQCPGCDRIGPSAKWGADPGRAYRFCPSCTRKAPGGHKLFVVPVRFIMACEGGHLDDFPWHMWVGHAQDCSNTRGFLRLRSERPGLAGLIVSCPECKARQSLDGIFTERTWKNRVPCRGRRPWLAGADQPNCQKQVRAMQRGASNLYFPAIESALSIPDWSDSLQEALGGDWQDLVDTLPEDRAAYIRILAKGRLRPVLEELRLTPEQLASEIDRRIKAIQAPDVLDLRGGEYRQFALGGSYARRNDKEFETRSHAVPEELAPFFSQIVRVVRLREVRAIHGFTRIDPEDGAQETLSPIWTVKPDWLPAIDVRGEGIFLEFHPERLEDWETDEIRERAARVDAAATREWQSRHDQDSAPPRRITARLLLVHTFAHVFMRQLTLECGYSTAALRERLYVREGQDAMAGVLIYTATSDADGTLGGLQRQGEPARTRRAIPAAIRAVEWCSSDPLCIEGLMSGADGLSLAACHACVLAPETSCEEFNRFLDRALLVGLPGSPDTGFFSPLLSQA